MSHFFDDFSAYLLGESDHISAQINETAKGDAHTRMDIYRHGYIQQLIDILADDFASIYQVLGTETFFEAGYDYLQRYPSTSYTVRHFGQHFAKFLSETAPYSDYPYLWQLADFEWAKGSVFDASDAPIVTLSQLADLSPADWPYATFEFIPALKRLCYDYNIPQLVQAIETEDEMPEPIALPSPLAWVMWRKDYQPHWYSMPADEDAFFIHARRGDDFASLCALLEKWYDDEDEISARAAGLVRRWIDSGMLTAINLPT